ncbi:MAG: SOS response-associated peptidase [Ornithinimicrobium sp.]
MCGRYAASAEPDDLIEAFVIDRDTTGDPTRSLLVKPQQPPPGTPDYNMAPSKQAPVVLQRPGEPTEDAGRQGHDRAVPTERSLRLLSWGLVPSWSKDPRGGVRMINARAETLLSKGAFARAARTRRCLVPATGWYEWQVSTTARTSAGKPRKQPFFITRVDQRPIAFAGLYEFWKDPTPPPEAPTPWLVTFTIITTAAEHGMDRIHDRQPVVLDQDTWDDWLNPRLSDPGHVQTVLDAPPPGRFTAWPVSPAVNAVANNSPDLLDPLPTADLVGVLDPQTGEIIGPA